jgi:hypothetical protein
MSRFQSYLFVGDEAPRRKATLVLAKSLGINLKKPSVDIYLISLQKPLPAGRQGHLSIDQIRQLKKHIFQKPIHFSFKFVIVEQAQLLTDEAQNALLKILEEPPKQAIIVLEATDEKRLLPTIRSRVLIKHVFDHHQTTTSGPSILETENTTALLEKITDIENPTLWLNNQILIIHKTLLTTLANPKAQTSPKHLAEIIEKCIRTKEMIEANVNPKFALFNLIFSLRPNV